MRRSREGKIRAGSEWKAFWRAVAQVHDRPGLPPALARFYRAIAALPFAPRVPTNLDRLNPSIERMNYFESCLVQGSVRWARSLPPVARSRHASEIVGLILDRLEEHAAAELATIPEGRHAEEVARIEQKLEKLGRAAERLGV